MPIAQSGSGRTVQQPAGSAPTFFTADFTGAENPISNGGIWTLGGSTGGSWNNPKTTTGQCVANVASGLGASRYDDSLAIIKDTTFACAPDQWCRSNVYKAAGYSGNGGSHEIEHLHRFNISSSDAHGYEILWGITGYMAVVKWNGSLGGYTAIYDPGLGSAPIPNDGDELYTQIQGNLITAKINGVIVTGFSAVDVSSLAVWATGQGGHGYWPIDGATPASLGWKTGLQIGNL